MAANDISGINPTGTPSSVEVFNAANEAISFREQLPDLEGKLREALSTKFNQSPLFQQRETAQQEFLAAPSQINADIVQMQQTSGVPLSPNQQQQITGSRRAAAFAPLSTANLLLNSQFGGLESMLQGGFRAFEAASEAKTSRANLMKEMRQQELERQFKEQDIALDWAKLRASEAKESKEMASKATEAATGVNELLNKINSVRSLIRSGKTSTGFAPNVKFGLQTAGINPLGILGKPTSEQSRLSTSISDLNTQLFEVAGKAFTGPEKDLLKGIVISMGTTPDHIEDQLTEMENIANRKRDEMLRQFLME